MKQRIRQLETAAILLLWWVTAGVSLTLAQTATEGQLKAAYLLNFAKFIEWPAERFDSPGAPMNFCSLGRSPATDELDSSIIGKSANGHPITVRHLRDLGDSKDCHLVFLAEGSRVQQAKLLQAARGASILLVAEVPGFARAGGAINFILEEGKLKFEVNVGAAEAAHLKISARLLALARIVSTRNDAKEP